MGSDSFLDIIANIVGILIILIVIAAIRVSQSPVPTLNIETTQEETTEEPEPSPLPDPEPVLVVEAEPKPEPAPEPEVPPEPVAPPEPVVIEVDEQLVAQVNDIENQLAELDRQASQWAKQIESLTDKLKSAGDQTGEMQQQVAKLEQLSRRAEEQRAELAEAHEKSKQRIDQLTRVLEEVKQQQAPAKELKHEVTPVSKRAMGKEIHFQIKHNQISVLPIEELISEMKEEIPNNLSWIVKFNEYNGEVGPIRGFRMKYLATREGLSTMERLEQGRGMMKVGVQRWELVEEELLLAESLEAALESRSSFQAALLQADANSTLTFWVYPDSFVTFQKLKEIVHQNGFLVAARPIPFGAPIAGSPNGTHSASQ
ncbi:MAG: hypothetical protein CMJ46_12355 [Planctomyces sp.]|nr:hypothetical protein [Planctomyces sp.]